MKNIFDADVNFMVILFCFLLLEISILPKWRSTIDTNHDNHDYDNRFLKLQLTDDLIHWHFLDKLLNPKGLNVSIYNESWKS